MSERSATLPSVSVIVPTWNRADLVPATLRHLIDQDYEGRIEVIVVDDGSDDDTLAVIEPMRQLATPLRDLVVVAKPHSGVAETIRQGMERVTGDYVKVVGSDDLLQPDHIRALVEAALAGGPNVSVFSDYSYFTDSGGDSHIPADLRECRPFVSGEEAWPGPDAGDIFEFWVNHGPVAGGLWLLPSAALRGRFEIPADLPEDDMWITLAALLSGPIVHSQHTGYVVRVHAGQTMQARSSQLIWDVDRQHRFFDLAVGLIAGARGAKRLETLFRLQDAVLSVKDLRLSGHYFRAAAALFRVIPFVVRLPRTWKLAAAAAVFVVSPSAYASLRERGRGILPF